MDKFLVFIGGMACIFVGLTIAVLIYTHDIVAHESFSTGRDIDIGDNLIYKCEQTERSKTIISAEKALKELKEIK